MSGAPSEENKIRDRFVAFTFAAADAVMEVADGKIVYASGAIESLTRRSVKDLSGKPFAAVIALPERARVQGLLSSISAGGRMSPAHVQLASGSEVMLGACRLPGESGNSIYTTLTQLVVRPSGVATQERDSASGALTRAGFVAALADRIGRGSDSDQLALLDLGDLDASMAAMDENKRRQLLSKIGQLLEQAAGTDGFTGQLGGGRFGVVGTSPIDEKQLVKDLNGATKAALPHAGLDAKSVTVALETSGLSRADASRAVLYAVQRFAHSELTADGIADLGTDLPSLLAEAAAAVAMLRETIRERRVSIALQPIVVMETGEIHHYEALCLLYDGSSAARLIAAAEQAALAPEFDLMVVDETLTHLKQAPVGKRVRVAINLSGRSVESPEFMRALDVMLKRYTGKAADLMFEITETAAIGNLARAAELVDKLRARGHPICIDDLGAGAASIQYLSAFTVDFAKIDGRYIRNAASIPRDKALLSSMIDLCRNLKVPVIVEWVETAQQAESARALGAELAQGYLFGRPQLIMNTLTGSG